MDKCDYKIDEIIGTGTFSTVYKCIDDNNNVHCIKKIKLINTSSDTTNVHFELIQQEIYLLQNLTHPRIIKFHGYFYTQDIDKYINIVMEYASFGPLSKLIAERFSQRLFLEENKIKQFLIDMMLGIEYLHMKNVVHKDIKPANILICHNERLKIADFGVSKITNIDNCDLKEMFNQNKSKEAAGSPIYMSPETLIHNHYTFSSDIWALGCILYELCTLQSAFGFVQSMDELICCTMTKGYASIDPTIRPYSMQLLALCDWMMTADMNKRPTVKDIISSPLIIIDYYHSYFQFDAGFDQ